MTLESARKLNIALIFFFGLGLATYYLFHLGPYLEIFRYDLLLNSPFFAPGLSRDEIIQVRADAAGPIPAIPEEQAREMTLKIPKISVDAPIVTPSDPSVQGVLASLESGVGLYPDSVTPGENGRAILLGHSSRASWYRGNYAYVFSLLSKLEKGDEFRVSTPNRTLKYRVFDTLTLSPAETNQLMEDPASGSELDLVTCYPVGSASQRTVIRAQLVGTENL